MRSLYSFLIFGVTLNPFLIASSQSEMRITYDSNRTVEFRKCEQDECALLLRATKKDIDYLRFYEESNCFITYLGMFVTLSWWKFLTADDLPRIGFTSCATAFFATLSFSHLTFRTMIGRELYLGGALGTRSAIFAKLAQLETLIKEGSHSEKILNVRSITSSYKKEIEAVENFTKTLKGEKPASLKPLIDPFFQGDWLRRIHGFFDKVLGER